MILSIIIPVYNVQKYIRQCLDSIYIQDVSLDIYEVIVINDGTPDNSMEIVYEFAEKYNNLQIINQENQGLSMARNNGLKAANGEYVWFIDSDDWIASNSITTILHQLSINNYNVISTPLIKINEDGNEIIGNDFNILQDSYFSYNDYFSHRIRHSAIQRFVIKRLFLIDNNLEFYPNIYHEDLEYGIKLIHKAGDIKVLKEGIYYYRIRQSGSITAKGSLKRSKDLIRVSSQIQDYIKTDIKEFFLKFLLREIVVEYLVYSIIIAYDYWNTNEYSHFYKNNKCYIKRSAVSLAFYALAFIKLRIVVRAVMFGIAPISFVKKRRI